MKTGSHHIISGYVLTSDQQKIAYDHYKKENNKVIILAHGFYNSKGAVLFKQMAEVLNDHYDVIAFDFRGHGKSTGFFSWTAKEHLDLEAILSYAQKEYKKIGLIGFSLGAAAGILSASQSDKITSLISVSAPAEFRKIDFIFWKMDVEENIFYNFVGQGRIGKGVRPGAFWFKKEKPMDSLEKVKIPILFIHGQKDWLIAPWHAQMLYKQADFPKKIIMIENGTHGEFLFRRFPEKIAKIFIDWFRETL